MNNYIKTILLSLCILAGLTASAQKLVVYSVTGGPQLVTASGKTAIRPWQQLTMDATVNIPYDATLRLVDEANSKQYVIRTPGSDKVSNFISKSGNSASALTQRFLQYMKGQMTNGARLTAQEHSDVATVTRQVAVATEPASNDPLAAFRREFESFRDAARKDFDTFRQQVNAQYAEFLKDCWATFGAQPPIPKPKIEDVKPIILPRQEEGRRIPTRPVPIQEFVTPVLPEPQPIPIQPIPEDERTDVFEGVSLVFLGTPVKVRFEADSKIALASASPNAISEAWKQFSDPQYNNTLADCLHFRQDMHLGDWAYLQLLKAVADATMGKGNASTLFMAYMYCQSGYQMRIAATDDGEVLMLFACRHIIYNKAYFTLGGEYYYPFGQAPMQLSICDLPYPAERGLSLIISEPMAIDVAASPVRTMQSKRYHKMDVSVSVNRNLIDFYDGYPSSEIGGDVMTRWAMYANTPLSQQATSSLYPAIEADVRGLSTLDAVNHVLNFVQTSLVYEFDDKVWGGDRAFFAEETLFYPYADCEDRSILFTRIVRDVLKLKTVLIYYPGHLATAVNFPDDVDGDYVVVGGERYTICDPTFIGAPVGRTMPQMDNASAKAIVLQ